MTDDELEAKYAAERAAFQLKQAQQGRFRRWISNNTVPTSPVDSQAGWTQQVVVGGDVGRCITATRVLAVGVFALAARKRTGHVYLDTYNADGVMVASAEYKAKHESALRKQAAEFNRKHAA